MEIDLKVLGLLISIGGILASFYQYLIYGYNHIPLWRKVFVVSIFSFFSNATLLLFDNSSLVSLLFESLHFSTDLKLPLVLETIAVATSALTTTLLLFFLILPQVTRLKVAIALEKGDMAKAADLLARQGKMFGGELGHHLELCAASKLVVNSEGVKNVVPALSLRFHEVASSQRTPNASDNYRANMLAEASAWDVLSKYPNPSDRKISLHREETLIPMLLQVAQAKVRCENYIDALLELERISKLRSAMFWKHQVKAIADEIIAHSKLSEKFEIEARVAVVIQRIKTAENFVHPQFTPWWIFCLIGIQALCILLSSIYGFSLQNALFELLGNKPFVSLKQLELWRLVTHVLVHADVLHFLANAFVIFLFGRSVAVLFGSDKAFAVLIIGAIVGGAVSAAEGGYSVGVGASTAAMAIYGFWFSAFARFAQEQAQQWIPYVITSFILVATCQLLVDYTNPYTDIAGHIGGLVGGVGIWILLRRKTIQMI